MRVLLCGWPKSGTTFLFARLQETLGLAEDGLQGNLFFEPRPAVEWPKDALVKALLVDPVSTTQDLYEPFEGWTAAEAMEQSSLFDVKILLLRDPRDRCISSFFYRWLYLHAPDPHRFRRAMRWIQHKELFPSDVDFTFAAFPCPKERKKWRLDMAERLHRLDEMVVGAKEKGWVVIRYEDLLAGQWGSIERALGRAVITRGTQSKNFNHIVRSRGSESWRKWFTAQDVAVLTPIFQPYLVKWGYETSDVSWPIDPLPTLNPSEGSVYMYGLFHHENGPYALPKPLWGRLKNQIKAWLGRT